MKMILHITSSARGNDSYSTHLGKEIINNLKNKVSSIEIKTWDLVEEQPPLFTNTMIRGFYMSPENPAYPSFEGFEYSDNVLESVNKADIIVISTPTHNFSVSAHLKAWIDQLVRVGITYRFDQTGSRVGLINNKKIYLAIASGGKVNITGQKNDYISDYIKDVLEAYVGKNEVITYRIEGTAFPGFIPDYEELLKDFQY
ncbi:NAD(P)H-dependent oxidoreductase [Chryseobacterium capnotolerans]|uniref:FMN-dependent NADH-azoreductase n=1 Tax=Chryseobacterium TaxID=59732 RepID=UPI00083A61E0|nr:MULTISPECIES: NAD(P)H-dependent oxidoreductase [Chryseobacterium]UHO39237.1 NAD(P)H-dependent oxidoreductase [Chryseobacterium capnotolerans]